MGASKEQLAELRRIFDAHKGKGKSPPNVPFKHVHWDGEDAYIPLDEEELKQRKIDDLAHEAEQKRIAANPKLSMTYEQRIDAVEEKLDAILEKLSNNTKSTKAKK